MKKLISAGADINAKDETDSCTPLICASAAGHLDIVAFLLRNGADVFVKDDQGNTALASAQNAGHSNIIDLLEPFTEMVSETVSEVY